jgi:hypothetical protein
MSSGPGSTSRWPGMPGINGTGFGTDGAVETPFRHD